MADVNLDLVGETDARKWASAFARARHTSSVLNHVDIADDQGTMLGWFANALEAGCSAGEQAADAEWTDLLDKAVFFELGPEDTLIVHVDHVLTAEEADRITQRLRAMVTNKVLLADATTRIEIQPKDDNG